MINKYIRATVRWNGEAQVFIGLGASFDDLIEELCTKNIAFSVTFKV